MDALHAVTKWVDHNRYVALALVFGVLLSVGMLSCQPKTGSLIEPGKKVTAQEFAREALVVEADVKGKLAAIEVGLVDLTAQYELRAKGIELLAGLGNLAATGGLNPTTAAGAVLQLLTLVALGGGVLDNRRKDKVIAAKSSASAPKA